MTKVPFPPCLEPWLEQLRSKYLATCITTIPTAADDEPTGTGLGDVREHYFEKRIKRISGGPPPRGKPKPPALAPGDPITSTLETAAVHRAIWIAEKR